MAGEYPPTRPRAAHLWVTLKRPVDDASSTPRRLAGGVTFTPAGAVTPSDARDVFRLRSRCSTGAADRGFRRLPARCARCAVGGHSVAARFLDVAVSRPPQLRESELRTRATG